MSNTNNAPQPDGQHSLSQRLKEIRKKFDRYVEEVTQLQSLISEKEEKIADCLRQEHELTTKVEA